MALAIVSLMQTLEQLLHPKYNKDLSISNYVETFLKELCSLRDLLQDCCTTDDGLETIIRNVACKAEDVIGSNLLDARNQVVPRFPGYVLKNLMDEVQSVVKEVKKLKKKVAGVDQGRTELSSPKTLSFSTTVVGLGDAFRMITNPLMNYSNKDLEVVSIVGMGGIGKTTLAKSVYRDTSVVEHFDECAWVTVSQEFQEQQVYLGILRCFGFQTGELDQKRSDQLAGQVYKRLKGRRYLIVLDDVWNTATWDKLRRLFPDDSKGSRIILTTRLGEVALYASSGKPPHKMRFLNREQGWELLSGKVFGEDKDGHSEFKDIGKLIVFKCRGLPLAILVVAGILSKVNKTIEDWQNVLENLNALVSTNAEDCFGILGLSYNHLDSYLKSCFVYTALFPEDAVIPVSKLIKLWIAEGLLGKVRWTSYEEVAETYLEELIDRSLVLICKRGSNGKAKTCMVHDLLRELCLREANAQKFLHLVNTTLPADMMFHTRFIFQSCKWEHLEKILEDAALNKSRSILIPSTSYGLPLSVEPNFGHFKLLRVLDVSSVSFSSGFLADLQCLIYLRYLAVSVADTHSYFFIENFHCLQTLVVRNRYPAPITLIRPISAMKQLRDMELGSGEISGPIFVRDKVGVLFPNVQKLSGLCPSSCGQELFRHIPNSKKLGIAYCNDIQGQPNCLESVRVLQSLIALKFQYTGMIPYGKTVPQKLNLPNSFPSDLKKLTLLKSCLPWEDMTILGKLPNLEILKLKKHAFKGPEWATTNEGKFLQLKVLVLESLELVHWKVSSDHFPRLGHLVVRHCYHLEGIPLKFGDISTLQEIELDRSNSFVVESAQDILEEQHNWGNHEFRVHFNSSLRICK